MAIYSNVNLIEWYPWLDIPYQQILTPYQYSKGHHAILLHSIIDNGLTSLCYAISNWLLCYQPDGIKSCGICYSCQLMIVKSHPDFYIIGKETWHLNLDINNVLNVINNIYQHAHQGKVKVVLFLNNELFSEQITNAMLKIIEEPPDNTYFLICCENLSRLTSTLKSRCLYWMLPMPQEQIGVNWLKDIVDYNLITIRTALRLSNNSILIAQKLLQPEYWKNRLLLCNTLSKAIFRKNMLLLLPILNQDIGMNSVHWLLTFISDAIKWQNDIKTNLTNIDKSKLIIDIARNWTNKGLHIQWKHWLYCFHQIQEINHINYELLFTNQLLNWEYSSENTYKLP